MIFSVYPFTKCSRASFSPSSSSEKMGWEWGCNEEYFLWASKKILSKKLPRIITVRYILGAAFIFFEFRNRANIHALWTSEKTNHANIEQIAPCFEGIVLKYLFFMHVWSGCDTSSTIFNQGRTVLICLIC